MSKTMTLYPRISEKAYGQSQTLNTYAIVVPVDANKVTVAEAVTAQFGVTVTEVNIMNVRGKVKRSVRKGGRATTGRDNDFKKAYVTLKEGDSIAVFAAEEEQDAKEAKLAAKKGKK